MEEPAVNEFIERLREPLLAAGLEEAGVAFHRGSPPFSAALDELQARDVVVVPVMMSRGYYSDVVLPRELAKNRRFGEVRLRYTLPLGLHDGMAALIGRRLAQLERRFSLDKPAVAIVGHGTARHPESRTSTVDVAREIDALESIGPAKAFFLDDEPRVEELAGFAVDRDVILLPFLISAGLHAIRDLSRRALGAELRGDRPQVAEAGGRRILIDRPVGNDPAIAELLIDLARS